MVRSNIARIRPYFVYTSGLEKYWSVNLNNLHNRFIKYIVLHVSQLNNFFLFYSSRRRGQNRTWQCY
jgi:hypothetical protein